MRKDENQVARCVGGPGRFPRRTIHLDFHTGPDIPDVGALFDAESFADTMVAAHVDSVTVFAKCHHGHLYFDTDRPERHPGLVEGLDLLRGQVEALHDRGIRAPIYISGQCDEYAANNHPDWIAMNGLEQVKWGADPFGAGWQILDMSSPYQDYLAEQIEEIITRFAPLDGLFLDMCWDQPSTSVWARRGMSRAGLDPSSPADRATYARSVAHGYMRRFSDMVEPHLAPEVASGVWFNSRPKTALAEEAPFVRHIEIEALPSGGWGYAYFPYTARFVRPLGKPTLSHTARFHTCWGDTGGLKPAPALRYETCQVLAQGMTGGIGDHLPPSGEPQPAVYRLIGEAYRHIARCEPFQENATVLAEAAIVVDPGLGDDPGPEVLGAVRGLQRQRIQFDVVGPAASLDRYELIVVPESTPLDPGLAGALRARAAAGRGVLVVRGADGPDDRCLVELGFHPAGPLEHQHVFLRPTPALGGPDDFDHAVHQRGLALRGTGDAEVLCAVVQPYFERSWDRFSGHTYTPSARTVSEHPAALQAGPVIVAGIPLFRAIATDAASALHDLLGRLLARLLPRPLVRADGPAHLETTVLATAESTVVHLLSFIPTRVGQLSDPQGPRNTGFDLVEDPVPLVQVPISVRVDRPVRSARLEPDGIPLEFSIHDGYLHTRVTVLDGHAMLVVGYSGQGPSAPARRPAR